MSRNPNTIDYSKLNSSLAPRNWNMKEIKQNTVEAIGKLFLASNRMEITDDMKRDKVDRRNSRLNQFADSIEKVSDWMKSNFILTIDYLVKNKLMKSEKIKSLNIRELEKNTSNEDEKNTSNEDEKLQKILDELTKDLPEATKLELNKHVSMELLNLSNATRNSNELSGRVKELEDENEALKADADASSAALEILEKDALNRWSFRNTERVANAIHKLNSNKELSQDEITRRVLWQADKFVFWWDSKSRRMFKHFNRMDVNKQYKKVTEKLDKKLGSAKGKELIAIRRIQIDVNKAHDNYINEISGKAKRDNVKRVNLSMAKAA